jgi:hypothetical protein
MLLCQKELYSLPNNVHYLNCAFMSPLLKSVEEAGILGLQKKNLPFQISGVDFFDMPQESRFLFARLINAPSLQTVSILLQCQKSFQVMSMLGAKSVRKE